MHRHGLIITSTRVDTIMLRDLFWGLKWGLLFALFFSIAASLMNAVSGGAIAEQQGVSLLSSIAIYVCGGLLGGSVLGLLRPMTRRRAGASVVGFFVMMVVGTATALIILGPLPTWDEGDWIGVIITAVLLGAPGGYMYWEPHPPKDR